MMSRRKNSSRADGVNTPVRVTVMMNLFCT